ncbi:transglycosylase family protein [Mycobacterium sp. M1]|uniref:Transglycosylase family protein n=1 Tax=Mycolicibacter acidiphilus TaxID=2835306 RepID=A0ABS5REZ0_9MYCO|nr:transglycosylase family protein [Mycolicibacter acidiphilus]
MYRNATRRVVRFGKRHWVVSGLITGGIVGALTASPAVAWADGIGLGMGWDAVAQCESGGNWAADTGNGFYGGLQFKPSTWHSFGGVGSPAKASREEQIAVANRVLDEQGPYAWPKCGPGRVFPSNPKGWVPPALRGLLKPLW